MSAAWSLFVIVLTALNILACGWLIRWTSKPFKGEAPLGEETGHSWDDGQLSELNNPLPRWWLWLFYITIAFSVVYLILYPGLGNYTGLLGWTGENQYEREMQAADARFGPVFANFAKQDVVALSKDPEARKVGRRLFANYCAQCHGSDAKGAPGFPNLSDGSWLYGGEPEAIKTSILDGRNGMMPPMAAALGGDQEVEAVVDHVLSLSGAASAEEGAAGKEKFQAICGACHMPDGTGNPMLGAPNLTDGSWLYGDSREAIKEAIEKGRMGQMPAHKEFLGEDKVHVLTAYVYGLSQAE